ncbi:MAG: histidine phosphatase family protein, partial [Chromatiales bacterium]|nr:histidine phosphatase family protein [Chromatiales bacterium]MDX9766013.1 histidine phosphatase family protein [Ectothiorhodospiraceae bacterium]
MNDDAAALQLILVRHAQAEDAVVFAASGQPDSLRPLLPEGMRRTRQAAKGLVRVLDAVDGVLSSPYTRARQTAEILAKALGKRAVDETEYLVPESDPWRQVDWLRDNGFTGVVMLVGHEPNLSALASCLLTGDGRLALDFRKG